jgi:nucleotide-binding universal stress UspA family protein
MYRSLIVPVDGSNRSHAALPVAATLAKASGATLDLVRVHLHERPDLDHDPSWDEMFREGERGYLDALARAYESVAGAQIGTELLDMPVVESIATFATTRVSPLIVMAARGRTGLRRALLGSTSDGLVRAAEAPVLILRVTDEDQPSLSRLMRPFKRLVVPLDGTAHAEAGVAHAVAIARATGAQLRLVRVIGPVMTSAVVGSFAFHPVPPFEHASAERHALAREYLQHIVDRIRVSDARLDIATDVSLSPDPATAIVDSCRQSGADLVVMATHGRGISRMLVAAVGDRVLRDGPDAVLFVRPEKGAVPVGLRWASRPESNERIPVQPLTVR